MRFDSPALQQELPGIQQRFSDAVWQPLLAQHPALAAKLGTDAVQLLELPGQPRTTPDGTLGVPLAWLARAVYAAHIRSLEENLRQPLERSRFAPSPIPLTAADLNCVAPKTAQPLPELQAFEQEVDELMTAFGTISLLGWAALHEAGHRALQHPPTDALHNDPQQELAADHWAFTQMGPLQVPLWAVEAHFKAEARWTEGAAARLWSQRLAQLQRQAPLVRQQRRTLSYMAMVPSDHKEPDAAPAVMFFVLNNLQDWPSCSAIFVEASARHPRPIATAMESVGKSQRILRKTYSQETPGSTTEFHFADVQAPLTRLSYGRGQGQGPRHVFSERASVPTWPILPQVQLPPDPRQLLQELFQQLQIPAQRSQRAIAAVRQSEQAQCQSLDRFLKGRLSASAHRSELAKHEKQLQRALRRLFPRRHGEIFDQLSALMERSKKSTQP